MSQLQLSAGQSRAQDAHLVQQLHFANLPAKLPLAWPTPPDTLPSPKKQYRSYYRYLGYEKLNDPAAWDYLSPFEILLYLIDFKHPAHD